MSKTDDIAHALRLLNAAFAAGQIGESEYERQDARLRVRQAEIKVWRDGRPPAGLRGGLSAPAGPRTPAALGSPPVTVRGPAQGRLAFPRRPRRADLDVRLNRRRAQAYAGLLPPAIARRYPVGQLAVLTIIADEHLAHGRSTLSTKEVADRAGCSERWARATLRLAARDGLLSVEHRPLPGRKSETNVVRIRDADWLAWLKVRAERRESGRIGGTPVPASSNGSKKRGDFDEKRRGSVVPMLSAAAVTVGWARR